MSPASRLLNWLFYLGMAIGMATISWMVVDALHPHHNPNCAFASAPDGYCVTQQVADICWDAISCCDDLTGDAKQRCIDNVFAACERAHRQETP